MNNGQTFKYLDRTYTIALYGPITCLVQRDDGFEYQVVTDDLERFIGGL
jgi:hypothetical protein